MAAKKTNKAAALKVKIKAAEKDLGRLEKKQGQLQKSIDRLEDTLSRVDARRAKKRDLVEQLKSKLASA